MKNIISLFVLWLSLFSLINCSPDRGSTSPGIAEEIPSTNLNSQLSTALDTTYRFTTEATAGATSWFEQTNTSFFGNSAAQSGGILLGGETCMETRVSGDKIVSFYWKTSIVFRLSYGLRISINDRKVADLTGNQADWHQLHYPVYADNNTIEWCYYQKNNPGTRPMDTSWVDKFEVMDAIDLAEALDNRSYAFTNSGNPWVGQSFITNQGGGNSAAQSGPFFEPIVRSCMYTTVEGEGAKTISFDWKISAAASKTLFFTINEGVRTDNNGMPSALFGGTDGWQERSYTLAAGVNALKWCYQNRSNFDDDNVITQPNIYNAGWVDNFQVRD